ncbi:MAG: LrgB family protein [Tissierellaceae bacterium]
MTNYLDTPLFGIFLSLIAFQIGMYVNKRTKMAIFSPLVIALIIVISTLNFFHIDYEIFNKGGSIITFFLGPATVILAVPLYKQINRLKNSAVPILIGIIVGSSFSIISVIILGKMFGLTEVVIKSLVPKATTTAISQELSAQIGGIPAITIAGTMVNGIFGNLMGVYIMKFFKVKDKEAVGVALGTTSHAVGTAKAMELGEVQGGMSSLSISIAGIVTVFLAPILIKLLMG